MTAFKPGDVVRLKSGGPAMTVNKIIDDGVHCKWCSGRPNHKTESSVFAPKTLEAVLHFDQAMGCYCFEKVASDDVPFDIRDRTHEVVEFVRDGLRLPSSPKVVWIRPALPDVAADKLKVWINSGQPGELPILRFKEDITEGCTPRLPEDEVWIRSDISDLRTIEFIAAHETRHYWQKVKCIDVFNDWCRAESDAYAYAYDAQAQYLTMKAELTSELQADIHRKSEWKRSVLSELCPNVQFTILDASCK
jgi:uncharacterized protein YodC (DUF2158 family)